MSINTHAKLRNALLSGAIALGSFMPAQVLAGGAKNLVAIGGSVTEIIYALGQDDRLIARDSTSSYPAQVQELPDVGYMRALSPEGVLAVSPGLIISEDGAGPPETIAVLESADIPFIVVPDTFTSDGILAKIRAVGAALDVEDEAETLALSLEAKLDAAIEQAQQTAAGAPKRVLFVLSTQGGRIMASGTNTAANGIIEMAGGVNVITEFEGYKPLSDEAISAAAPDVILMMLNGGDHGTTNEDLFAMPALIGTPAAQANAVVRMDGLYLLGFGPRTADAIVELNNALYNG